MRSVEDGELLLLDELVALQGAYSQRVGPAFELIEELRAVVVFPGAGVYCAAAQPNHDGHVLDADGALEFARAAGGALEDGFLRVVFSEQRVFGMRAGPFR